MKLFKEFKQIKKLNQKYIDLELFINENYTLYELLTKDVLMMSLRVQKRINWFWYRTNSKIINEYRFITRNDVDLEAIKYLGFKIKFKKTSKIYTEFKTYICKLK